MNEAPTIVFVEGRNKFINNNNNNNNNHCSAFYALQTFISQIPANPVS